MNQPQPRSFPAHLASFAWRLWYPMLTGLARDAPVPFLNYGYAGPEPDRPTIVPLESADEPHRPCIQLYHRVVGGVDLRGQRVLEVSCGHGGGASYMARYLRPAAIVGVDRNPRAVALCKRTHRQIAGLSFALGDAMKLSQGNSSMDAVVNVEASHCYPDVPRFFSEVCRVLKPGGRFLYADFRSTGPASDVLRRQMAASGMRVDDEEDISSGVVHGMGLNTPRYQELIRRLAPSFLHATLARFAGVEGSPIYQELKSGDMVYARWVLRKP